VADEDRRQKFRQSSGMTSRVLSMNARKTVKQAGMRPDWTGRPHTHGVVMSK
jgi:hypothetical protein